MFGLAGIWKQQGRSQCEQDSAHGGDVPVHLGVHKGSLISQNPESLKFPIFWFSLEILQAETAAPHP